MALATQLRSLARTDMKLIGRDRFLLGGGLFILFASWMVRLAIPPITSTLADRGFDFTAYYSLLSGYLAVVTGPQLGGLIFGFTLLDTREVGTLKAILVSPLPAGTYLLYRVGTPIALSCLVIPAIASIVGAGVPAPGALLAISTVAAISAAIWVFFVASFADNKVQAFALMKIVSGSGLIVLGAFFVPEPWQYLAGVHPSYWAAKAYWVAGAGGSSWWVHAAVGALVSLGWLGYMIRRFRSVAHR